MFLALTAVPDWVMVAFQELAMVWLPGQVQVTVQPAVELVPVLVTVIVAWKPLGQELSTWRLAVQALAAPEGGGVGLGVTDGRGVGVGVGGTGVGVTLGRGVGVGVITGVGVTLGRGVGVGVITGVGVGVTPPLAAQASVGVALAPLTWMPKVVLPPAASEPL
jgi:hypothetical protein